MWAALATRRLQGGILTVERSGTKTKSGVEDKKTKTERTRRLAIDAETVQLLTERRNRRRADCGALGVVLSSSR
ncbi:hypothetical protein GCM10009539_49040 [Cryptosporangium japonicum]|uniref:Transposase n=1 Tax=Cryptosporangium japonicum TaxID=80872 RepID=A0ABP3EB88_9ACTN